MEYIGPQPEELDKISEGSYIAGVMPYVRAEIEGMIKTTRTRIFTAITSGSYTIEQGDSAWRELYAYHRLLKRLETKVRMGQYAGGKVAKDMTIGGNDG